MDINELIMGALQYVIEVSMAALVPVVMHYILTKVSKAKLEKYATLATAVVRATQQTLGAGNGAEKKRLAEQRLSALTKGRLTVEQIDTLLEAAVHELNKGVKAELDKVK